MTKKEFVKWYNAYVGIINEKSNRLCRFYREKYERVYKPQDAYFIPAYVYPMMHQNKEMYMEWADSQVKKVNA